MALAETILRNRAMMRQQILNLTHSFLRWAPPALIGFPFLVATAFPESRRWFIDKYFAAIAWIGSPTHFILVLLLVGFWILAILLTASKHDYQSIDEKLGARMKPTLPSEQAPPPSEKSPSPSEQPTSTGTLHAKEVGEDKFHATGTGTGTVGLRGLYVGNIIAAAGGLKSQHRLEIAIIGFNGTGEMVSIGDIAGHISAGTGNLNDMQPLKIPELREVVKVGPKMEFTLVLNQELTPTEAKHFLSALRNAHVQLDLDKLRIKAVSLENPGRSEFLHLWDAVRLRRRDDIVSNRVHVLKAEGIHINRTTVSDASLS